MPLTREDVEQQVFKERFRGYDQDEVDRFLDRVAATIGELTKERDELQARMEELERRAKETSESEKLLQRTLMAAQRRADETVDEARATAEQTLADARTEAGATIADAQRHIDEHERRVAGVVEHVRRAVEDLARLRSDYRERVEAVMAEQLAVLDRAGDLPELPESLRSLGRPETGTEAGGDHDEVGRVRWDHDTQI